MGEPFRTLAAGCGGYDQHLTTPPSACFGEVVVVGLVLVGRPGKRRAVWRGFACSRHAHQLLGARPLLPRDRDVLARRREERHIRLAGHRWAGEREGPLARGREADELIQRAEAWLRARGRARNRS